MQYAFFIDIDGTLQNDNGEVSNRCKNIIRNIISIGHIVVLCTARPRFHAQMISEEIGASNYILSSNGAELYDYSAKRIIFCNSIPNNVVTSVMKKAMKNNLRVTLAINDSEYIIGHKYNDYQLNLPSNFIELFGKKCVKQFMIIDDGSYKIDILRKYIEQIKDVVITSKYTIKEEHGNWFSFVEKNTSKGNGIALFSKLFSIPKENIISIGNDYNDISMFKQSGISVAVKNATEDVIKYADEITDSNNEDGVAKILEKIYLNVL